MNVQLFGFNICSGTYKNNLDQLNSLIEENKSSYVCFVNAHMIVEATQNKHINKVLSEADSLYMDGMSLIFSNRLINKEKNIERFAGMDVIKDLVILAEKRSLSIVFYGSTSENLIKLSNFIRLNYPKINKVKYISPPFRKLEILEKESFIDQINQVKPDIIFVSLGCPKQEIWMHEMRHKLNKGTMLGVGNAILTFSNQEKRSPRFFQKVGLEWLFRLYLEPRRLFKRYFSTNTMYLLLTIKEIIKKRLLRFAKFRKVK